MGQCDAAPTPNVSFRMLTILQIQNSGKPPSWVLITVFLFRRRFEPPPSCSIWSLSQCSTPTLVFKLSTLLLPTSHLLPLHLHVSGLYSLLFLPPRTRTGFFNEVPEVLQARSAALFHFILSASRYPTLTHLPFSEFSALRSDHSQFRTGILSPDDLHASGGDVIFVR